MMSKLSKLNKRVVSILLVICMLFGVLIPLSVHAEEVTAFGTKVYNFESDAVGSIPEGFVVSDTAVKVAEESGLPAGESNKVLYIKKVNGKPMVSVAFAEQKGEFSVEFRIKYLSKAATTQHTVALQDGDYNNGSQTATLLEQDGLLKSHNGKAWQTLFSSYEINAWYYVKMDVDAASKKFDITVAKEGEAAQTFSDIPFRVSSVTSISYFVISTAGSRDAEMFIDDIKVPFEQTIELPEVAFDFEDDVVNTDPKDAVLSLGSNTDAIRVIEEPDNADNNILRIKSGSGQAVTANFNFASKTDTLAIGLKMKLGEKTGDRIVNLYSTGDSVGPRLLVRDNAIQYRDGSAWVTFNANYEVDKWYSILIMADITTDTYDLYVDGALVKAGIAFAEKVSDLSHIEFSNKIGSSVYMYVDDIAVDNPVKNDPVNPDVPDIPDVPEEPEVSELEKYVPEYCDIQLLADGSASTYLAFPSILKLSDERVIIAYKASTAHMDVEAELDLIVFNPTTKQIISKTTIDGTVGEAAQNVELIQTPNGDIVAYIDVQRVTDSGQTRFGIKEIRSTDGGDTWKTLASDGTYKSVNEVGKHEYKVLKDNEGIIYGYVFDEATVDGTVYMLAMSFPDFASAPGRSVHVIKSSDNGATWTHVKNLTTTFGIAFNESSIEACDGGFIVNCRKDSDGKKGVSYRTDMSFNVIVEEDYSDYADVIVTTHRPKIIEENGKYYLLGRNAVAQSVYTALALYEIDPLTLRPLNYIELHSLSGHTYQHSYYAEYYLQEDENGRVFFNVITYDDSRNKNYPDIVRYEYLWEELLALTPIDLHTHVISEFDDFSGRFICVECGKYCEHTSFTEGKCDICGIEGTNVGGAELEAICTTCNSVAEYRNGVCAECGTECSHKFNLGGHCVFCGELGNAITFADGQNGGGNLSGSTNGKALTVGDTAYVHSDDTQLWDYRDADGMLLGRDYVFSGKFTFNEYTYNSSDEDGATRLLIWSEGDVNYSNTKFALYLFGNNGKLELSPYENDADKRIELTLNKEYDIRVAVHSKKSACDTYTSVADVIVNGTLVWTKSFTLTSENGMAIRVGDHTTRQTLVKYNIAKGFGIHCLDSNVNFIGTQQKENANYKWDTDFDLRFIFSLDDLYLEDVGVKVDAEMSGGKLYNDASGTLNVSSSRTVLNSVMANGEICKPGAYGAGYGGYYLALAITAIPLDTSATYTFTLTPYVTYHGGETVFSETSHRITVSFNDYQMNIGCEK